MGITDNYHKIDYDEAVADTVPARGRGRPRKIKPPTIEDKAAAFVLEVNQEAQANEAARPQIERDKNGRILPGQKLRLGKPLVRETLELSKRALLEAAIDGSELELIASNKLAQRLLEAYVPDACAFLISLVKDAGAPLGLRSEAARELMKLGYHKKQEEPNDPISDLMNALNQKEPTSE